MEKPTVEQVTKKLLGSIPEEWFKDGFAPLFAEGNVIWLRQPGWEDVIRITVEDVPREEWPKAPLDW